MAAITSDPSCSELSDDDDDTECISAGCAADGANRADDRAAVLLISDLYLRLTRLKQAPVAAVNLVEEPLSRLAKLVQCFMQGCFSATIISCSRNSILSLELILWSTARTILAGLYSLMLQYNKHC